MKVYKTMEKTNSDAMVIGKINTLAVTSFALGLGGVTLGATGVAAIVTGHWALKQLKRDGAEGKGLALAGLIMGYVSTGVTLLLTIFAVILGVILGTTGFGSTFTAQTTPTAIVDASCAVDPGFRGFIPDPDQCTVSSERPQDGGVPGESGWQLPD